MNSVLLQFRPMDIHTRRREKLEELIASKGGVLQRVADEADVNDRYLSQIRNQTRNMGSAFARKVEAGMGLPNNWFDVDSDPLSITPTEVADRVAKMSREERMVWLQAIAEAEAD